MLFHVLNGLEQSRILEKGAVANRFADACIVLQYALARTNILMPNLGISHLPLRETNREAGCSYRRMRPNASELVDVRSMGLGNSIALFTWIDAPSIHNN